MIKIIMALKLSQISCSKTFFFHFSIKIVQLPILVRWWKTIGSIAIQHTNYIRTYTEQHLTILVSQSERIIMRIIEGMIPLLIVTEMTRKRCHTTIMISFKKKSGIKRCQNFKDFYSEDLFHTIKALSRSDIS